MRIVIGEDSSIFLAHLVEMLREIPGVVVVGKATDAVQAMQVTRDLQPDLLILNFQMPGGGGIETLKQVKSSIPSVIVMVITNLASPEYRDASLRAGADYFFDKSFDLDNLKETIKSLMKNP